jgi:hypothetical protein
MDTFSMSAGMTPGGMMANGFTPVADPPLMVWKSAVLRIRTSTPE